MSNKEKIFLFVVLIFCLVMSIKSVFSYSLDYKNANVTTNCTIQAGGYTLNNINDGNYHYNDIFQDCVSFYPVSSPCSIIYKLNATYLVSNYSFILAGDGSGSTNTNYWNVTNSSNIRVAFGNYTATGSDYFNVTFNTSFYADQINLNLYQIPVAFFVCEWIVNGESNFTPPIQFNIYSDLKNSSNWEQHQYTFFYNGTVTSVSNIFNCSYYINGVLNNSKNDIDITTRQNFSFSFLYFSLDTYNMTLFCKNNQITDNYEIFLYIDYDTFLLDSNLISNSIMIENNNNLLITIWGELKLLGLIIAMIACLIAGILSNHKWIISISGVFSLLLCFNFVLDSVNVTENQFALYRAYTYIFLFLGILFLLLGIIFQIYFNIANKEKEKSFYPNY